MTVKTAKVEVCGNLSEEISKGFSVKCTEQPGHSGIHRTIFSVYRDEKNNIGFEYSWEQK